MRRPTLARSLGQALAAIAVCAAPCVAQVSPPRAEPVNIELNVASTALPGNPGLLAAAGETLNRAADLAVDRAFGRSDQRAIGGAAARLARLWCINLPIAALTTTTAHDSGHFARAAEFGATSGRWIKVTQWPWPVPIAYSIEGVRNWPVDGPAELAAVGGGEEGSHLQHDRMSDDIYAHDRADYFKWILLAYAGLDFPLYAWTDLSGSHTASPYAFYSGQPADFRQYVAIQSNSFAGFHPSTLTANVNRIRGSAWLNLFDVGLWTAFAQTTRYVVTGERIASVPAPRIGSLGIVPSMYATLGPLGLERGAEVRLISQSYLVRLTVREMAVASVGGRWGVGAFVRSRSGTGLRPEAQVDVWHRLHGEPGIRIGIGARRNLRRGAQPFETSVMIGYKSEGAVGDAPLRAGFLMSASTAFRF